MPKDVKWRNVTFEHAKSSYLAKGGIGANKVKVTTLRSHVRSLIFFAIVVTTLFTLQLDYDRKMLQYRELTAVHYLVNRAAENVMTDLKRNSMEFLNQHYRQLNKDVQRELSTEFSQYDLGHVGYSSVLIPPLENTYLSYENYSLDDVAFLWNQERIGLELPVLKTDIAVLLLRHALDEISIRDVYQPKRPSPVHLNLIHFDTNSLTATFQVYVDDGPSRVDTLVSSKLEIERFLINDLNILRTTIDALYNATFIVDDIEKTFESNFPSLQSMPQSYFGLSLEKALFLLSKDIDNAYVKYSPPAAILTIMLAATCLLFSTLTTVPKIQESRIKTDSEFILQYLWALIPFVIAALLCFVTFSVANMYVPHAEWLFVLVGVLTPFRGLVFAHRYAAYVSYPSATYKCPIHSSK